MLFRSTSARPPPLRLNISPPGPNCATSLRTLLHPPALAGMVFPTRTSFKAGEPRAKSVTQFARRIARVFSLRRPEDVGGLAEKSLLSSLLARPVFPYLRHMQDHSQQTLVTSLSADRSLAEHVPSHPSLTHCRGAKADQTETRACLQGKTRDQITTRQTPQIQPVSPGALTRPRAFRSPPRTRTRSWPRPLPRSPMRAACSSRPPSGSPRRASRRSWSCRPIWSRERVSGRAGVREEGRARSSP